ncbi:MAG: hypothetical protein RI942_240 [Pseudomonadota bacterium]|jgi:hypothetical protein
MPNFQKLNNIDHQDLRVLTGFGAEFGDDVMFALTFPAEMRSVQAQYPILIYKDPATGKMSPVALFGFERGENLFLNGAQWEATYVPAMMRRQPFLIGEDGATGSERQRVVAIDMDHPRVSRSDGELLFMEQGSPTEFLERQAALLESLHGAQATNEGFISALTEHALVQPVTLSIRLKNGAEYQLQDFYALDDEAFQKIEGPALTQLQAQGWLLPAYMMLASMSQLAGLIDRKNKRTEA